VYSELLPFELSEIN